MKKPRKSLIVGALVVTNLATGAAIVRCWTDDAYTGIPVSSVAINTKPYAIVLDFPNTASTEQSMVAHQGVDDAGKGYQI